MSSKHDQIVKKEIGRMFKLDAIVPTIAPWSFPIVIAAEKNGQERFCFDYESLNQRIQADN